LSHSDFAALATTWHDFYLTAGAAAAALIGLLFVGVSINLDQFTTDDSTGVRILAEQAFANFIFVLVISLFVLIPDQDQTSLSLQLSIVGILGTFRIVRRAIRIRQGSAGPFTDWRYVARRLGLPAAASLGVIAVAVLVSTKPVTSFYWLVSVILIYLTSAADSAWDLLIEVGRERRRPTS
jgi:4-amino-4-deoxy-L-arabinose transferase-like glycosyltransferase